MVFMICRTISKNILRSRNLILQNRSVNFSTTNTWIKKRKKLVATLCSLAGGAVAFVYALDKSVKASELELHAPHLPWYHMSLFNSLDHASVKRGYSVYKNVCSACHSVQYLAYRDLVGVTHSESEAKAEAEDVTVKDGPNEEGEMFTRPGRLSDYIPGPYANQEAARAANNGAYPPDLTHIIAARHNGEDYVFHLLMGYTDTPAGISLREGQHFNPYFMGTAIGMAKPLYTDVIEYSDGTPAYASQLAKDVVSFLVWASDPDYNERKKMLIRLIISCTLLTAVIYYYKRHKWSSLKNRIFLMWPPKTDATLKGSASKSKKCQ